ncbi:MAG TPA: sulfurtransferase-like selenium metabolism protein YedF [Geobacteraceae bacterium]|nr:sulfurtransferase-like selenium metabolism protein YedF [Geobacteraceae bacterium]
MNEHTIDARALRCPQPLMMAKKALEGMSAGERLRVQIDNETARDNLLRFLRDNGMTPGLSSEGGVYTIEVEKVRGAAPLGDTEAYCAPVRPQAGPVIVLNHHGMGSGSEELGRVLLQAFVYTLQEVSPLPSAILCYNGGVLAAAEGAPTVPALTDLVSRGVTLLLCGTCVDYYDLKGRIAVGMISNMYEILRQFSTAERVITL